MSDTESLRSRAFVRAALPAALAVLALAGCAESGGSAPVRPVRDSGADATTPDLGTLPVDLGPRSDAALGDAGFGALAINEVRATGDDWIELMNTGTTTLDLSGLRVADLDETTGLPKVAEAVTVPAGTTLAPGAYLVVLAGLAAPRAGVQTGCLASAVPTCLEASFGLSGTRGDQVFVLAASTDAVLASTEYPAPPAVPDGSSWSRLPNGVGAFAVGTPTPGAENVAAP